VQFSDADLVDDLRYQLKINSGGMYGSYWTRQ